MDRAGGRRVTSQHLDDHVSGVCDGERLISRHQRLKSATAASHAVLDSHVGQQGYFSTLTRYTDYVFRMHEFERGFEAAATGIRDDWLEQWNIAQRVRWLRDDLSALSGGVALASPPIERATPTEFASPSELLGGLYVVMGSGLGARVLATRSAAIGLPAIGGNVYLTGIGDSTRWGAFVRFLEAEPNINTEQMCAGALATFVSAYECLAEPVIK